MLFTRRMADTSGQVFEAISAASAAVGTDELQAASARVQSALGAVAGELDARAGSQGPLWRLLVELHQLEREVVERRLLRRMDALERVQEAVRGLGEIGSAAGILDRSAAALGEGSDFDRVVVSSVADGAFAPVSVWVRDGGASPDLTPVRLGYPLVEEELARRQGVEIVSVGARSDARWASVLGWESYAVATVALGGTTVGFVHADAHLSERALDEIDRETLAGYAEGLAAVFERAVLRGRLRAHRSELRSAVDWMNTRLSKLSESSGVPMNGDAHSEELDEVLTPRELEVLRLMARGNTNVAIAKTLVVAEGTVKYHVKNVLRKLRAANRADAVARYERMTAGLPE